MACAATILAMQVTSSPAQAATATPHIASPVRPAPQARSSYAVFVPITTRWSDNDVYGHVNNVIYYSWFDTAVNAYLIEQGALDYQAGSTIGLVVETQCNYFAPVSYPQAIEVGIRVAHMGSSSVRYEIGIFLAQADAAGAHSVASGHFVHVYVDRQSRRPCALPEALRKALAPLLRSSPSA